MRSSRGNRLDISVAQRDPAGRAVFSLAETSAALEQFTAGKRGKIVISNANGG